TPTAAAELCCRSRQSCIAELNSAVSALTAQQLRWLERAALRLDRAVAMVVSPQQRLHQQNERLQMFKGRLAQAARRPQESRVGKLAMLRARLSYAEPKPAGLRNEVSGQLQRLDRALKALLDRRQQRLFATQQTLQALSPRNILGRGYAIVRTENGDIVKNALDLSIGEQLSVEL